MKRSLKICLSIIFSIFMLASPIAIGFLWKNDLAIETSKSLPIAYIPETEEEPQDIAGTQTNEQKTKRVLPSEYTQVEYIYSTKKQFLDTEIFATGTTEIMMKIEFKNEIEVFNSSVGNAFMGASDKANHENFSSNFGAGENEGQTIYNWCDIGYSQGERARSISIPEEAERTPATFIRRSGYVSFHGSKNTTDTTSYEIMNYSIALFGNNNPDYGGTYVFTRYDMYMYYCKIFDGGIIVRDFVPCVRNVDGEAGLYDFVSQEFYVSSTGENFAVGPIASAKSNYRSYDDFFYDYDISYSTTKDYLYGDGSLSNPFIVKSTEAFFYLRKYFDLNSKYIELHSDIVFNEEKFDKEGNYSGGDGIIYEWPTLYVVNIHLDGKGNSFYGFYKDFTREVYSSTPGGLFQRYSTQKEIKNINIENVYINAGTNTYISFFGCHTTKLENCNLLSGFMESQGNYLTGLACGVNYVDNCANYIDMYSEAMYFSGIVASIRENGEIKNCKNYGDLTQNIPGSSNGRLSGILVLIDGDYGRVTNCVNYGDLTSNQHSVAGIIVWGKSGVFNNCINYGKVSGPHNVGGICAGENAGSTYVKCKNYGEIYSSSGVWSAGQITGYISKVTSKKAIIRDCEFYSGSAYPIVGRMQGNLIVENCYFECNEATTRSYYFVCYAMSDFVHLEISNILINIKNSGTVNNIRIFYTKPETSSIYISNVLLNIDCDANSSTGFLFGSGTKTDIDLESYVINIKTTSSRRKYYYGTDFSNYYCDWKTGEIGLKALSGKGFYQSTLTEQMLIEKGYTKKAV